MPEFKTIECNHEQRHMALSRIELRESDDGPPKLVGYAAVFDSWSEQLGWFREIIRPGAFKDSLARGDDVRALIDHSPSKIIGRRSAKTLDVREDDHGLYVEIALPDTTAARDLIESMKRGDIDGMSFQFITVSDRWGMEDGDEIRELLEVKLIDVSVVTFPAYSATDVGLRAEAAKRSRENYMRTHKPTPYARMRRQLNLAEHDIE